MAELDYQSLNLFIHRAIANDSNAFAEIYAGTYQHQYQFAYYFLKDVYQAQDALIQVYTYALKNLKTLKDTSQLIEWLEQINYHICYQMLYPTPTSQAAKLIWDLPYLESASYIMFAYQDMSIQDIALATERSKKEIRRLISMTQKKLLKHDIPMNPHITNIHIEPAELDAKGADVLLTSILVQCGYDTQRISISTFRKSHLFRHETYAIQKVLTALIFCSLLAVPLLFFIPHLDVSQNENNNNGNVEYNITVDSLLRVKNVTAQIDGNAVMIYETANKVYTIEPETTGTATVTVTLENGQYNTTTFQVSKN